MHGKMIWLLFAWHICNKCSRIDRPKQCCKREQGQWPANIVHTQWMKPQRWKGNSITLKRKCIHSNGNGRIHSHFSSVIRSFHFLCSFFFFISLSKCVMCLSYNCLDRIRCCSNFFHSLYFSLIRINITLYIEFYLLLSISKRFIWHHFPGLIFVFDASPARIRIHMSLPCSTVLVLLPSNSAANARFIHTHTHALCSIQRPNSHTCGHKFNIL